MAANVDSPKRRSLRSQNARAAAGNGPATTDSGTRSPAGPRTSGSATRMSAEKRRVDPQGEEGSSGNRRSAERLRRKQDPQGENGTDQGTSDTAPSTGMKEIRNNVKGAPSMEVKSAPSIEDKAAKSAPSIEDKAATSIEDKAATSREDKAATSIEDKAATSREDKAATSREDKAATSIEGKAAPSIEGKAAPSIEGKAGTSIEGKAGTSIEGKAGTSIEDKAGTSIEDKAGTSIEGKAAPSIEDKAGTSIEGKAAPSIEDKAAPSIEDKAAPSIEGKAAPSIEGKAAPSIEDKAAPSIKDKAAPSIKDKAGTSIEDKAAPSMEPNDESGAASHSPGAGHSRNLRPIRNHDSFRVKEVPSPRGAAPSTPTNTSIGRVTRSSKGKNQEEPRASPAVRGPGEGANSSKAEKANLSEARSEKGQGAENPDGSSGSHDRSLRPRRSRDGSSTAGENSVGGAAATNTSLKRETRSSAGKNHQGYGASDTSRGRGASSGKKVKNADVAEADPQKEEGSGDPGGSSEHDGSLQSRRSHEGFNVEDGPGGTTNTLSSRKTRASRGKDLEEPGVSAVLGGQQEGAASSKQANENPKLAEPVSRQGEGSEEPGGSSSHNRSLQPKVKLSRINVEVSPTGATVTNTSFSRAEDYEKPKASSIVKALSEGAVSSKEEKQDAPLAEPNSQDEQESGGSNRHNSSLQRLRSHEISNVGSSSPTKRQDLPSKEVKTCRQSEQAQPSTGREDRDALLCKGESVMRPGNQQGETLDISGGVRSPGKDLRPRRSNEGSGSGDGNNTAIKGSDLTPCKENKTELVIQGGEVSGDPAGNISPRKNVRKHRNLEDPVDDLTRPSTMTTEGNAEEAARDYKVRCCSKQMLQEVLGMCTGICKELVDSQQYLSEEQKQRHYKNFVRDFETAFQENVTINGLSWHEAPDKDSEPDIKMLEDQMDEAMVETSMKRKRYPRKILSHFVKALKTEREILNQYKPVVNQEKLSLDPAFELRMKDLSATAATVSQHIHETKKALPLQLEKAEGFSQVLNLQPVLEGSRIRKDIFQSRVVLEDISKRTPKVLEETPTESAPQNLATPVRSLRKREISLPHRHLYPLKSKRKISLDS
ncbi:kinetochore-associated protein NSL1 homolog [Mantella aurantiaca]